jgi:hypothetical protein
MPIIEQPTKEIIMNLILIIVALFAVAYAGYTNIHRKEIEDQHQHFNECRDIWHTNACVDAQNAITAVVVHTLLFNDSVPTKDYVDILQTIDDQFTKIYEKI